MPPKKEDDGTKVKPNKVEIGEGLKYAYDSKDKKDKGKEKYEKKQKDGKEKEKMKEKVLKTARKKTKKPLALRSFQTYIHRVLKTIHKSDLRLSGKSMEILDSFANDLFDRLTEEAVKLLRLTGKRTLSHLEVQTAARLILPGDMSRHAVGDGAKAVGKFTKLRKGEEDNEDVAMEE